MLPDWIQTIDAWLREHRPEYYAELQPGLSREQIAAAERRLDFELPEALVQLYLWKDGQVDDCYDSFYYNFMFPSLEASVATAMAMKEDAEAGEFSRTGGCQPGSLSWTTGVRTPSAWTCRAPSRGNRDRCCDFCTMTLSEGSNFPVWRRGGRPSRLRWSGDCGSRKKMGTASP